MTVDTESLLSQLTLEEKISLLAGQSTWRSAEVKRLGIPNIKVPFPPQSCSEATLTPSQQFSDGPSGARGEVFGEGVPAAFLPSGVSLGATWDVDLLQEMGELLAEEVSTIGPRSFHILTEPL